MTGQLFVYFLLRATAICGTGLLCYALLLRNGKGYAYNRMFLLGTVAASLIIPCLHFSWPGATHTVLPAFRSLLISGTGTETDGGPVAATAHAPGIWQWLPLIYGGVCLGLLGVTGWKIFKLFRLRARYPEQRLGGVRVVMMSGPASPFSFGRLLFWNTAIPLDSREGAHIWQHELTHIREWHTLDKLLLQLVLCLFWINPCYWIVQRELGLQHEFAADEAAIAEGDTEAFARMLLSACHPSLSTIAHSFFHSPIKRRLRMILQTDKLRYRRLRKLLAIPLMLTTTCLFAFDKSKQQETPKADRQVILALDAGHGGADHGATGRSGVLEKDLTLRIARKVAALAPEYNVSVISSRAADETRALDERVSQVNGSGASLYIGLHVNKQGKDGPPDGYELLIGRERESDPGILRLAGLLDAQFETIGIRMPLKTASLKMLRDGRLPGIVIECGDIDNEQHLARLRDERQLEAFCRQLLTAVVRYSNAKAGN